MAEVLICFWGLPPFRVLFAMDDVEKLLGSSSGGSSSRWNTVTIVIIITVRIPGTL